MIKFVSYTGKYPNLCKGILTVEINGIEIKFGHNFEQNSSGSRFMGMYFKN